MEVSRLVFHDHGSALASTARPLWVRGHDPAHAVAALGLAVALTLVVVESALRDSLGLVFDLGFVGLSVLMAMLVRPGDFVVTGLLPPVVMIAVFALLGLTSPGVVAHPEDGVVQATVSGLGHHSAALFAGYASCLATLAYRLRFLVVEISGSEADLTRTARRLPRHASTRREPRRTSR
jgi:hypothetical protein